MMQTKLAKNITYLFTSTIHGLRVKNDQLNSLKNPSLLTAIMETVKMLLKEGIKISTNDSWLWNQTAYQNQIWGFLRAIM